MKMSALCWRVVSLWLCLAAVCRYPSYYVGCTESHQEAQQPESPQDISAKEESGEKTHHKVEETLASPAHSSLPINNPKQDDDQQKEEQMALEEDKTGEESEVFQEDEPTQEVEPEGDSENSNQEPVPEEASEIPNFGASITQDQEFAVVTTSPEPLSDFMAGDNDTPGILNIEDNIPDSVPDAASDAAVPEVADSDLPPVECEEDEEANPYDSDSSPPKVLENISNAHTAGTKTHTDPPLTSQAGQHVEVNVSQILSEEVLGSHVTADTDPTAGSPEDIPTFDEWKRKMMEVEKEKTLSTHTSNNEGAHVVKKVPKNFNNYASVECGAKILGANPEAKSTSAILTENMDLYMLNPCSNKIWFIIELCEPIQVKQLDIANFELFSSTPKDFLVSISDRYPTNKWLKLGTFHGRDERTIQSFPLDEHLYAKYIKMFTKYIKVELVSHFGSEHFCPLSLIRVFGTSMVEEYDDIANPSERPDDPDDDLDYPPGYGHGEVKHSKNLIGSAKDVILNMVNNIAVNVLGGSQDMQGNLSSHEVNKTEPSADATDATTQTPITDLASVPESEEVEIPSDVDTPESGAPSSETVVPDPPITSEERLSTEEAEIITPLEKDEEQPISSTIILLDKEEELDEEKEKKQPKEHQQSVNCCPLLPSFSSCSCSASLQEYLQQRCSAPLFKQRRCQSMDRRLTTPSMQTPAWQLPSSPTVCPQPTQHHSEAHQPRGKEQASDQQPDGAASPSGEPQPTGGAASESHKEPVSERPLLEPSQTSSFPRVGATDSSAAKPTPIVETPQLSSEEPAKQPEKSQEVLGEEKHIEALEPVTSSVYAKPSVTVTRDEGAATQTEEKLNADATVPDIKASVPTPDVTDQSPVLHPTAAPHLEPHPDPPAVPESSSAPPEQPHPVPETPTELEPSVVQPEDLPEENPAASGSNGGQARVPALSTSQPPLSTSLPPPSLSDIYAEPPNGTEQNGNPVHGSSQKESVFMRLNNRIKALEMNMSLSGRYLEQLSQRYRKQMEEMQKAFNKTIIKLQNTSRIAEEQDQRQTDSIQLLQGQLENVTQLVLNLSVRVSQLQNEVSDREHYLLLSLALCVCLGLALFSNCCRVSTVAPAAEPETPFPKSYSYYCPDRQFSSGDDAGLKRSASYPLIHSDSLQLATTEGPESLHVETQSHFPAIRKRRRRKVKAIDKVETLTPSFHAAPELCNGAALCNGVPVTTKPMILTNRLLQPTFRDSPSEGSSEASSHSDDPSFCGITTACSRICDGLPPAKSRAEKRALRRRRLKPPCAVVDFLHAPRSDNNESLPIATIEDIMNRKMEQTSGTYGVIAPLSGPVYLKE